MGWITNQWIKGKSVRDRGFYPTRVRLTPDRAATKWDRRRGITVRVNCTRDNGDYQTLYIRRNEAYPLLWRLAQLGQLTTQQRMSAATILLSDLSDAEMISVLRAALDIQQK
jgi:hypothetical protein